MDQDSDTADPTKHIIPDPETSPVVRQIFDLFISGKRFAEITKMLEESRISTPSFYYCLKYGRELSTLDKEHPYTWSPNTVTEIIDNDAYIGSTTNLKTEIMSYKVRKLQENDNSGNGKGNEKGDFCSSEKAQQIKCPSY